MKESKSRCPACNPIHQGSIRRTMKASFHRDASCVLCKGSKLVPTDMAKRYVAAMFGNTESRLTVNSKIAARPVD